MQRVDRLLIQVKRAYGVNTKQVCLGFVNMLDNGKWEAKADLWDGKDGSQKPEDRVTSIHDTKEEAISSIEALAEAYAPTGKYKPLFEDVPILIMDYGLED